MSTGISSSRWTAAAAAVAVACAVGAVVVGSTIHAQSARRTAAGRPAAAVTAGPAASALDAQIARTQARLRALPRDWSSWASLGLAYVQQAKLTVDPTYYPKAQSALARSLQLNRSDNFIAMAGQAALASARHDFPSALSWSRRGLAIDPRSAVLYGALSDALTQLGHYDEARAAAAHMEAISPGTDAESRLSYAAELRGQIPLAVQYMQRALDNAGTAGDVAFTRYYLGELAMSRGDARAAFKDCAAGLEQSSADAALLEGRAKAEAALGRTSQALTDFATVVDRVPQPTYVLEYGELLQSLGRTADASDQYALFRVEEQLFATNGVTLDTDETLFEADHGSHTLAVKVGAASLRSRPFLDSFDAYAWALHRVGRDAQALGMEQRALSLGSHNASYLYHRAAIEHALHRDAAASRDAAAALRLNPHFNWLQAPDAQRLAGPAVAR